MSIWASASDYALNVIRENVWGFALGIPSGALGIYAYNYIETFMANRSIKLDIIGTWGEFAPDSDGHRYSLGRIYLDRRRKIYRFDGTNYRDSGEPFCHWETVVSYLDVPGRKFFYLFTAQMKEDLDKLYYGFGVINLSDIARNTLAPVDGHYTSVNVDGRPISHSMLNVSALEYRRGTDGRIVVDTIRGMDSRR
jgi:hypothetical protein